MAAFDWTPIGAFVDDQVVGDVDANELRENIDYNNEVLSQWHDVDNAKVGNASGQGQSGQLRYGTGAGIFSTADTNGDLDSHKIWVDFSASLTVTGTATPVVSSIQLDDITAAFGFDWKKRDVTIRGILVDADSNLPGGANEGSSAFVSGFSDTADTTTRDHVGPATDDRKSGDFLSSTGRADGVVLTTHNVAPANLTRAGVILQGTFFGGANVLGFFHANSAAGVTYSDGDLIFTMSSDDNGGAGTVNVRFIGTLECSGQRT